MMLLHTLILDHVTINESEMTMQTFAKIVIKSKENILLNRVCVALTQTFGNQIPIIPAFNGYTSSGVIQIVSPFK